MVTTWMGDRYVLGCVPIMSFLYSQILCRLSETFPPMKQISRGIYPVFIVCIRVREDYIRMLKVLWSVSDSMDYGNTKITHVKGPVVRIRFDGLWKHQNNPVGTESVSLQNVGVGHYTEEEDEE